MHYSDSPMDPFWIFLQSTTTLRLFYFWFFNPSIYSLKISLVICSSWRQNDKIRRGNATKLINGDVQSIF